MDSVAMTHDHSTIGIPVSWPCRENANKPVIILNQAILQGICKHSNLFYIKFGKTVELSKTGWIELIAFCDCFERRLHFIPQPETRCLDRVKAPIGGRFVWPVLIGVHTNRVQRTIISDEGIGPYRL